MEPEAPQKAPFFFWGNYLVRKRMKLCILICLVVIGSQAAWSQTTIDLENQVRGELPVAQGGTGAADAGNARSNLAG